MSTLLLIVVAALLFLAAVYRWQDRLLYFPQRVPVEQLTSNGLQPWPSAQDFRGLLAQPAGAARGTVVVFHGNAGHAGHRAFYAHALVPLGWRVVLAEYPGYGPRGGAPGEATLVEDARQTLALVRQAWPGPVLVLGESLGAAVAAGAAALSADLVSGLLLVTPWDRLAHVAAIHYPWLPARWLLRDDLRQRGALGGLRPAGGGGRCAARPHRARTPGPGAACRAGRAQATAGHRGQRPQRLAQPRRCPVVAHGGGRGTGETVALNGIASPSATVFAKARTTPGGLTGAAAMNLWRRQRHRAQRCGASPVVAARGSGNRGRHHVGGASRLAWTPCAGASGRPAEPRRRHATLAP